jgi:hypothetical protein
MGQFRTHISQALYACDRSDPAIQGISAESAGGSAVLFLLSAEQDSKGAIPEPHLVLNKRSDNVRQAGDLCCPGGGISLPRDARLGRLLALPGSPLTRWSMWRQENREHPESIRDLPLLLATSLRESYEEMRLNPLKVSFLGSLPVQRLSSFGRQIYPMVGWASPQKRYVLNWEVDSIVTIPLRKLLDAEHYARTRFSMDSIPENTDHLNYNDYTCFLHRHQDESEILWGATFRITMLFLEIVFGFTPPANASLPLVHSVLNKNYLTGNRRKDNSSS